MPLSTFLNESDRTKICFSTQKEPNLEKAIKYFFWLGGKFHHFHHRFYHLNDYSQLPRLFSPPE